MKLMKMMIQKHIDNNRSIIYGLVKRGYDDENIISLILVETYFRTFEFRILEYLYWILFKDNSLTLGLAQINMNNIPFIKDKKRLKFIKYIHYLESPKVNYELIQLFLKKHNIDSDEELCKYYNGKETTYEYVSHFKYCKAYLKKLKDYI